MKYVRLNEEAALKTADLAGGEVLKDYEAMAEEARKNLVNGTCKGNDYIGWVNLPEDYDKEEFARIKQAAAKICADSEVLIVIGIGGSYLGARAAISFLRHSFYILFLLL